MCVVFGAVSFWTGVFWADDMTMSSVLSCPSSCGGRELFCPGDGDGGGDGDVVFCPLIVWRLLVDATRFGPLWDMKMDGEGALLMGLYSWLAAFRLAGVGGCGASLPDSNSDGSPATWAPVGGSRSVGVFLLFWEGGAYSFSFFYFSCCYLGCRWCRPLGQVGALGVVLAFYAGGGIVACGRCFGFVGLSF